MTLHTTAHRGEDRALSSFDASLLERVAASIAPAWPLDRSIAVNPFWELTGAPFESVAARLTSTSGARLWMPRSYYRAAWTEGRLRRVHLERAAAELGGPSAEDVQTCLVIDAPELPKRGTVVDVADAERASGAPYTVRSFVIHHASQHCASFFDGYEATLRPPHDEGLFASYVRVLCTDPTLPGALGVSGGADLSTEPAQLARRAFAALGVPEAMRETYLHALLLDLHGWASHAAYRRWTARQEGRAEDLVVDVLAIRLAWEWLLFEGGGAERRAAFRRAVDAWPSADHRARAAQRVDAVLQRALEIAWRDDFVARIPRTLAQRAATEDAQVVFCIDVRSERLRRALEARDPRVRTLGFAGFFGVPMAWQATDGDVPVPRLPGLVAPKMRARDERPAARWSGAAEVHRALEAGPLSIFAYVEALGIAAAPKLLAEAFARVRPRAGVASAPVLESIGETERVDLAQSILRGMGLTRELAPVVVLVGHGSTARNNPQAAALQCGACGGHAGDVNARLAAGLLGDRYVRAGLRARGIDVPDGTCFVAALHDTTTDEVRFFDDAPLTEEQRLRLASLREAFARAADDARRERAAQFGGCSSAEAAQRRARDWGELRPEWGLADNVAFVAAPRARTLGMDLGGRVFLHEYSASDDPQLAILELVMTAPMVVAHWINLQYYASTVDNDRFGSGNKVLHNVVGGNLGVFEGNGGDLRIGLALQSLNDGERWIHTPRRLSVFIEAPAHAIDAVLAKHAKVRSLVENRWLFLHHIDPSGRIHAWHDGRWVVLEARASAAE